MQFFDRASEPAPACLSDDRARPARDALLEIFSKDERVVSHRRVGMAQFAIKDPELDSALRRLFRGKCSFCESALPFEAHRIRPTEEAGPSHQAPKSDAPRSHLYYTWLTNAWQNIYAICDGCRPDEPSLFPVQGSRCRLPTYEEIRSYVHEPTGLWRVWLPEQPLFLDPCGRHDFRRHLAVRPSGELIPVSKGAAATIHQYHLNRPDLINSRATLFDGYIAELTRKPEKSVATLDLFSFRDLEYGGSWYLLLYQLAQRLGAKGGRHRGLTVSKIRSYYEERLSRAQFRQRLLREYQSFVVRPPTRGRSPLHMKPAAAGEARPIRFEIRNFKALENLDLQLQRDAGQFARETKVPLAPCLIILGENAAGKSSVLEAIALVLADRPMRRRQNLNMADLMLEPALLGGEKDAEPREGSVSVTFDDGETITLRIAPGGSDDEPDEDQSEDPVLTARIPVFAYGAFRLFLNKRRPPPATTAITSLFDPSFDLPNPEEWLSSISESPFFDEVIRALRSILAIGINFQTIDVQENGRCFLVTKEGGDENDETTISTPLTEVSSGFRSVLGMACDVMRRLTDRENLMSASLAKARGVVLIDEVEAHLHPRWKIQIMQGLREALPNVIFIVTTHDPLSLRGMAGSEVLVLRRVRQASNPGEKLPINVERVEDLPPIGTLTVEQILTSEIFDLYSTDDPGIETTLALIGDALAIGHSEGRDLDALHNARETIRREIAAALPVGSTAVQMLVQEAVEGYLRERRLTASKDLSSLREGTKREIISALRRA